MKTFRLLLGLTLFTGFISCEDIIEEDITNDVVQIISPNNGTIVESNVVNFQWETMKGADKYHLQVFNDVDVKVLDSVVENSFLQFPLESGLYKWRIRGENFGYTSTYNMPASFEVMQSDVLTNQVVILSSPSNNYFTNATTFMITWQNLEPADSYDVEIVNVTNGNLVVYQQQNITNTSLSIPSSSIVSEAEYQWKVKAKNATSESVFSNRTFKIDRTNPNQPQLTLPNNNSTQLASQVINFSWNTGVDSGVVQSNVSYLIEISNSNTFSSIIQSSNVITSTIQLTFSNIGDYYWRVKSVDSAGNISNYSTVYKFTIN
jgi:hypothetical protein